MKSRLSIEIKGLLEPKKLGASRYNPESSSNITTSSTTAKPLKRSGSSSTLRRTDTDISLIEDRYRLLEHNYRELLEETRNKGELFRKQREELDRLRQTHDRDQKEIAQLRTLLEIARRNQPPAPASTQPALLASKLDRHSASVPRERKSPAGKGQQAGVVAAVASGASGLRKNSRVRM